MSYPKHDCSYNRGFMSTTQRAFHTLVWTLYPKTNPYWKPPLCIPLSRLGRQLRGDSCTRGFLSPTRRVAHTFDWPWNQKTNPDRHPPLCTPLKPSGRQLLCCGFSTWSLRDITLNLTLTLTLHLTLSITLTLKQTQNQECALTSPSMDSQHWCHFGSGNVPGLNPNPK